MSDDKICFVFPRSLAGISSTSESTETALPTVAVATLVPFSIQIGLEMAYEITSIKSPNYLIKLKKTQTKATIEFDGLYCCL